ncbi:Neopullulanase [Minicystis rosea]|nr:Neopullulanase [Minicystis rosea]
MPSAPRYDARIAAPSSARHVALYGEMGDWLSPIPFVSGEARLSLPAGVYAYKLEIDGAWALDPASPRTRAAGEHRNNVLSVGGAAEPLLFAPAAPWLADDGRGGVTVVAALRRGAGDRLWVRWTEAGAAERRTAMEPVIEEREHVVFRVTLPISSASASLRFELEGGQIVGPEDDPEGTFAYVRERVDLPAWWARAVVCTIFVDRFRAADDTVPWGVDPGPRRAAGGHLEGVRRSLDYLRRLGIDTLYLTPIHLAASCHRYDVVDPLVVDPALGGDEALDRLVADVHACGMRLVVDFSFSHAGRGFPAYEEVLALGREAPRAGWFRWAGEPPALVHYGTRTDAPLFDLDHPEVQALVLRTAERWARRGIDGLRIDAAAEVPIALARAVRSALRAARPDAVIVGELVPRHAFRWRNEGALDAATDFGFHATITDFLAHGSIDAAEAKRRLLEIDVARGGPPATALRFVSTHDHPRFATLARLAGREPDLGYLALFTMPGVPALLYGEEHGLFSDRVEDLENVWPDRMPMPWRAEAHPSRLHRLVQSLALLRAESTALREGSCDLVHGEGSLLVYRRAAGGEVIDVALNAGDASIAFDLEDEALPQMAAVLFVGDAAVDGQAVALGPRSGVVVRRSAGRVAGRRLAIAGNERIGAEDFRATHVTTRARPTRIDFAVTERCNLRCRHCITDAPERTRSGAARTLPAHLVDRLRDDLAFVAYAGFVHGGEPLSAPVLFEVLAALREARAGEPYVAHLLTNGVLLGERMVDRLVEVGVSSISVSLDGATAATNDAVREGGRFQTIVDNLRGAVRRRRALGADLRLGVSAVVMAGNAHELDALVDLCADAGVDWIKLEEMVPVNAFAERSLVALDRGLVRDAVARAVQRAASRGLVAVDHTAAPVVWRCRLASEPETARFLAADEHANRSVIHPCRGPWDHACIAANGDVSLGDFFGPVIGNLADESLVAMWNGTVAQSERRRAMRGRPCGTGPVTCMR